MQPSADYLAIDLGASSGRAILVQFDGRRLTPTEMHRFENGPMQTDAGLFWDAPRLFVEIKRGLRACSEQGHRLRAIGIDTWGVDFGLLDSAGELLAMPRHYRDSRHAAAMEDALRRVTRERIYESTGIQFMPFNTLYQLSAEASAPDRLLDSAARLLFMPDLFNYWLTGTMQTERSIASTSQAMNACTSQWDGELLVELGVPVEIMPAIQSTGSLGGRLTDEVAREVGHTDAPVVLTASHDTAAAVAAVPARGADWAYISSGTWSLVGVELSAPLISVASREADFTNEAGVAGTVRFLKNVAGLWLVQECRRCWEAAGRSFSFAELAALAEKAEPLRSLIDPDDPRFATPGDMPQRIRDACRGFGQSAPADEAAMVRCILDSLALRYDEVLRCAAALTGRAINTVHVVGGGSQNDLLNRLIAAATDREVVAGPAEATALGNAAVQAIAVGDLADVSAARRVIAASVDLRAYEPPRDGAERETWTEARQRFGELSAASLRKRRS
jgi:sugar (pentulose or hexulose) kinase